jgi:adenylosuccinate lyase
MDVVPGWMAGGGDRQELHERIREYSLESYGQVAGGGANPLLDRIAGDADFRLSREEIEGAVDARAFTGRSAEQVEEFLAGRVEPLLEGVEAAEVESPRI